MKSTSQYTAAATTTSTTHSFLHRAATKETERGIERKRRLKYNKTTTTKYTANFNDERILYRMNEAQNCEYSIILYAFRMYYLDNIHLYMYTTFNISEFRCFKHCARAYGVA